MKNNIYWMPVHDSNTGRCSESLVQVKNGRLYEPVTGYEFNNKRNERRFGRYIITTEEITPSRLATLEQCERHVDSILDGTNETFNLELDIMQKEREQLDVNRLVKKARRDFARGVTVNSDSNNE